MSARVNVRCPACGWTGQREPATALEAGCHRCGVAVEFGRAAAGRPRDPRRVALRPRILGTTATALAREAVATGTTSANVAAAVLDGWAAEIEVKNSPTTKVEPPPR